MANSRKLPRDRVRAQAWLTAERQHHSLGTDQSKRIDIFDIIERDGLWLMFQPLKNLYGSCIHLENSIGVLINANHPLNLQRFTAAHEYAHYVLGHKLSLDDAESIQPSNTESNLEEVAAQSFAATFLMPLQLVNTVLRDMGMSQPEYLTPKQAYLFSLEVGASYPAAVNQLATLGKINWRVASELRRQEPKDIKAEIGHGVRPENAWADTWPLDEHYSGKTVYPRVNDELHISLPETPSTGYIWIVDEPSIADIRKSASAREFEGEEYLALVDEAYESNSRSGQEIRLGAGGFHHFIFRPMRPGIKTLRLVNLRPWLKNTGRRKKFEIFLNISPSSIQGLREQQKPLMALGV